VTAVVLIEAESLQNKTAYQLEERVANP